MARPASVFCALAILLPCARATTLERISLDDMIAKSTAIVRGRVVSSQVIPHNTLIYTHFTIQVLERWKGVETATLDVAVPGGTYGGLRQSFPGTPALVTGREYLLFLWKGTSGITHVIGLGQGALGVTKDEKGSLVVGRGAIAEPLLDPKTGKAVTDSPVVMRLSDMRDRISTALARGARQ